MNDGSIGHGPETGGRSAILALARSLPGMSSNERLRAIMSLPDPDRFVRNLRPDELFYLVKGIGTEDSIELLEAATREQRQVFADMEAWSDGRFQPDRFADLFELIADHSPDLAARFLRWLDPELLALHLFRDCRIIPAAEAEDMEAEASFRTPDGVHTVLCPDQDLVPHLRRFFDILYSNGVEFAHRIVVGGSFDTPSSLEDIARHLSSSRLQDFGFPDEAERFLLWEPFDVAALRARLARLDSPVEPAGSVPALGVILAGEQRSSTFWRAFSSLLQGRAVLWTHHLLNLVNRVIAALTGDPSSEDSWARAAAHTLAYVNVGLEDLSSGAGADAARVMEFCLPVELYRTGFEQVRVAHLGARKIAAGVGGAARLGLFGHPWAESLAAMTGFPPLFHEAQVGRGALQERDFRCMDDVRLARRTVDGAAAVLDLAVDVLGFRPGDRTQVPGSVVPATFMNVIATGWARMIISDAASLDPLSGEEVARIRAIAFEGNRIKNEIKTMQASLDGVSADPTVRDAVRDYVDRSLAAVEEALATLDPARPVDVRFIGDALLVRIG